MKTHASNDSFVLNTCAVVIGCYNQCMDTDSLRWFQQIAGGWSLTEVSETEYVTQSGLSRRLSRLEVEVGAQLLRKTGRNLRMTVAGAAFKRPVAHFIAQLDR